MNKFGRRWLTLGLLPMTMNLNLNTVIASSAFAEDAEASLPPKSLRRDVCKLPGGPTNSAYLVDMRERFYRNLPSSFRLRKDVVLRFFLTAKGLVRDVSIIKSSGSRIADLTCIDAACCASPLPAPPTLRIVLKAPPEAFLYEPNEYGEGVYTFTFSKSLPSLNNNVGNEHETTALKKGTFELLRIPKEVLFRYPGLFTATELADSTNKISAAEADPYLLECMRSPWALRYTISDPSPSKSELLDLSRYTEDKYIKKKEWLRSLSQAATPK